MYELIFFAWVTMTPGDRPELRAATARSYDTEQECYAEAQEGLRASLERRRKRQPKWTIDVVGISCLPSGVASEVTDRVNRVRP